MDIHEDETHLQTEIIVVEQLIEANPNDFLYLCKASELYLRIDKLNKCWATIHQAINVFKKKTIPVGDGLILINILIKYWQHERYTNKSTLSVNFSKERSDILNEIWDVLSRLSQSVATMDDANNSQIISLKMAYIKECMGSNQDSLSILSDLIASHAVESIDLSYVIFKAAITLKHIGQNKQAIEYLEFLQDDPPTQEGYTKLHVVSFLILLYEQSGDKYKVFLPKTYKDLVAAAAVDITADKISTTSNFRKLNDIIKSNTLNSSSELWEILALQALEKCEYVMAIELFSQAIKKAPTKGKLLQIMGEVYYLLNNKTQSLIYCEKAVALLPQNAELRNLLLLLNPDKYAEKLRVTAPVIHSAVGGEDDGADEFDNDDHYSPNKRGGKGRFSNVVGGGEEHEDEGAGNTWVDKIKSKASDTIKSMQDHGVTATILAPIANAAGIHTNNNSSNISNNTSNNNNKRSNSATNAKKTNKKNTSPVKERPQGKSTTPRVMGAVESEQVYVSTKPVKPVISDEAQRVLRLVMNGNKNLHLYDPTLATMVKIRSDPNLNRAPRR